MDGSFHGSEEDVQTVQSPSPIKLENKPGLVLVADNTHLEVARKREKWIRMEEGADRKAKRKAGIEEEEEDKERDGEQAKPKKKLLLCTAQTKYRVVKKACRRQDFRLDPDEALDWDIYWADTGIQQNQLYKLRPYQRINHYPGMHCLSHKNNLCRNLKRMQRHFEREFDFFPKTWILPYESSDFKNQFTRRKAKTFIVKPVAACQGRGIFLTRDFEDIKMTSGE
jgi:tubulin polyglutamylase TTLL6/13